MKHKTGRLSPITKGQIWFLIAIGASIILFMQIVAPPLRKYANRAVYSRIRTVPSTEVEVLKEKKNTQTYTVERVIDGDTLKLSNGEREAELRRAEAEATYKQKANVFTLERVIDGNTIKLTNGETVRLIGIETSESMTNEKASNFLKGLFRKGDEVILEFDDKKRDKDGRLLAYVLVHKKCIEAKLYRRNCPENYHFKWTEHRGLAVNPIHKKVFLNATIIKSGYAQPMTIPPNVKYAGLFEKLYQEARKQGRGLWKKKIKN